MKRTIRKVLDELEKDKPDLSYIRGMLEVLIDEDEVKIDVLKDKIYQNVKNIPTVEIIQNESSVDEASILEAKARDAVATIKALSDASTE